MINLLELETRWHGVSQHWERLERDSSHLGSIADLMQMAEALYVFAMHAHLNELTDAILPVKTLLESNTHGLDVATLDRLREAVVLVSYVVNRIEQPGYSVATSPHVRGRSAIVWFVGKDKQAVQETLSQLEHFDYQIRYIDDPSIIHHELEKEAPQMVLMFVSEPMLAEQTKVIDVLLHWGIPWIALSYGDTFNARLMSVRHQASAFFQTPLDVNAVVDVLDQLNLAGEDEPYRILVLDDSATALHVLQKALRGHAGVHTRGLKSPESILETIRAFSPDVLLFDFHLAGCTGLEVAMVIRQVKAYEAIPIVYLSSELDEAIQLQAIRSGADEFLSKPVRSETLVSTVLAKAERYRLLRKAMIEDGLTGLYNHTKTKALLEQALLLASRQNCAVSYAMLDIDHFKGVNDRYGHPIGDQVISTLARFLKQRVRQTDMVGRYGGEEFAIIFYNTPAEEAHRVLEKIRSEFAELFHQYADGVFQVTISIGLADYPSYPTVLQLTTAADEALYQSKRQGRNRTNRALEEQR